MRKIKYFDREISVEEYIKIQICKNGGTQSVAFKEDLVSLCDTREVTYDKSMDKEDLFDLLVKDGFDHRQFAEKFGVGVSSQIYQQAFRIQHKDVKRLEKKNVLKKVGEYRFRAWGKYQYAPLYDVYQYALMTEDEMQQYLH